MMKRTLVSILAVLIAVLVMLEVLLPNLVAQGIERGLEKTLGTGEEMVVRLDSYPSLKLLLGRFDNITIESRNLKVAGLEIDTLTAEARDVVLNLRQLLQGRTFDFDTAGDMTVNIEITEQNLNDYLWAQSEKLKGLEVSLGTDGAVIQGPIDALNNTFNVKIEGQFIKENGTKIAYVIHRMTVNDIPISEELKNTFVSGTDLYIDLSDAPFPLEVTEVKTEDGKLLVQAVKKAA